MQKPFLIFRFYFYLERIQREKGNLKFFMNTIKHSNKNNILHIFAAVTLNSEKGNFLHIFAHSH